MQSISLKSALLSAVAVVLFAGTATTTDAQEAGVETVVVTGSRIHRPEADQPNPVVSVSAADIENSGTTNLTDYLKRIPALTGSLTDFSTSGYNTPSSTDGSSLGGLNLLSLRNLGYARTLVLVDGKRTVGQATGSTAVDINSIPMSLLDRVEVVTGGSSAVYGADGVSGVVNFVMKHNFEGVRARAQVGTSQDGGGSKYTGSIAAGHNFDDDKGNVSFAYEWSHQDSLYYTQRSFTKVGGYTDFVSNPAIWTAPTRTCRPIFRPTIRNLSIPRRPAPSTRPWTVIRIVSATARPSISAPMSGVVRPSALPACRTRTTFRAISCRTRTATSAISGRITTSIRGSGCRAMSATRMSTPSRVRGRPSTTTS